MAVGPPFALALADYFGYKITFMIGSCMMLFAAFMAFQINFSFIRTKKFRISMENIVAKESVLPAALMFFLSMTACVINSFLILFAGVQQVANIGYYFTVYAGTLVITRPLAGYLTDRLGLVRILIPAMAFFAGAFVIISYAASLPVFLLAAFVSAFGFGACHPIIQTYSMKCVPAQRRGAASSTNYIGLDLGNLAGPVIAGLLVDRFSYPLMWRIMIFPVAFALLLVFINRSKIDNVFNK